MRLSVRSLGIGLAVSLPLVVLLGFGFRGNSSAIRSPLVGHRAPDFTLTTLDGRGQVRLSALRGRPVVLNFWQSSCLPCRTEHPDLVRAFHVYGKQVAFVGVSYEDTIGGARAFLRSYGGGWPMTRDPDDVTAINYGVYGIPETFFIDRAGVIRYKSTGPVTSVVLHREIHTILRGRA